MTGDLDHNTLMLLQQGSSPVEDSHAFRFKRCLVKVEVHTIEFDHGFHFTTVKIDHGAGACVRALVVLVQHPITIEVGIRWRRWRRGWWWRWWRRRRLCATEIEVDAYAVKDVAELALRPRHALIVMVGSPQNLETRRPVLGDLALQTQACAHLQVAASVQHTAVAGRASAKSQVWAPAFLANMVASHQAHSA